MKLNLGYGDNKYQGFINVDKFGNSDLNVIWKNFPGFGKIIHNKVDKIRFIDVL